MILVDIDRPPGTSFRAYSSKKGHACGITKKGQESPLKGDN